MQTDIIYNLDCIKNINKVDDNSVHLILSDIPYGIGIDDWDVLHDNTNSAYLGLSPAQQKAGAIFKKRGKPYPIGTTIADNIMNYGVGAFNETALSKYCLECNNLIPMKSLKSDTGLHTTQKPLDLMKILIELTTVENQIVLDPFAGSGTTLLAAKQLNRQYIGFETNKEYCNVIVN